MSDTHVDAEAPVVDQKALDLAKAREAGWSETTAFNYDEFTKQGGHSGEWQGMTGVYEWNDEYGDVAPELPELERMLYGTETRVVEGKHRDTLDDIEVVLEGATKVKPIQTVSSILHIAS